jgi:hypothetical protein
MHPKMKCAGGTGMPFRRFGWGSSAVPPCVPAAEGRIGHYHVIAVFLLNVGEALRERVGVNDVGRLQCHAGSCS